MARWDNMDYSWKPLPRSLCLIVNSFGIKLFALSLQRSLLKCWEDEKEAGGEAELRGWGTAWKKILGQSCETNWAVFRFFRNHRACSKPKVVPVNTSTRKYRKAGLHTRESYLTSVILGDGISKKSKFSQLRLRPAEIFSWGRWQDLVQQRREPRAHSATYTDESRLRILIPPLCPLALVSRHVALQGHWHPKLTSSKIPLPLRQCHFCQGVRGCSSHSGFPFPFFFIPPLNQAALESFAGHGLRIIF